MLSLVGSSRPSVPLGYRGRLAHVDAAGVRFHGGCLVSSQTAAGFDIRRCRGRSVYKLEVGASSDGSSDAPCAPFLRGHGPFPALARILRPVMGSNDSCAASAGSVYVDHSGAHDTSKEE